MLKALLTAALTVEVTSSAFTTVLLVKVRCPPPLATAPEVLSPAPGAPCLTKVLVSSIVSRTFKSAVWLKTLK